jgi:hypothetical protein
MCLPRRRASPNMLDRYGIRVLRRDLQAGIRRSPHQFANIDPRYANGPTYDEMPQNVAMPNPLA